MLAVDGLGRNKYVGQSRLSVPGRKALKKLVHIRNAWLNPTCITDAAEGRSRE